VNTDDLINFLGTNVEPVKSGQLRNTLLASLAVGAVAALCLTLVILGLGAPNEAFGGELLGPRFLGLVFTLGVVLAGTSFLLRAARPGTPGRRPLVVIGLLFFALLSAGVITLVLSHPVVWGEMVFGPQWAVCLVCIPLFAIAPFASLIWALRKEAPTNPAWTGAVAGLVAGALGAAAFALHHPAGSILFILLWYGGPIVACTLVGAILGPRLLRW
jgi:hypothetical protein